VIERINSLVQAAKVKARGYRSTRNLKAMVYLIAPSREGSTSSCQCKFVATHSKQRGPSCSDLGPTAIRQLQSACAQPAEDCDPRLPMIAGRYK
jgi:hypothetical protein